MTTEETSISPELQAKAEAILRPAFTRQNMERPLVRLMYEEGIAALASDIAANPRQYQPVEPPKPAPMGSLPKKKIAEAAQKVNLPALPEVALKLQQIIADPQSSAQEVANVISLDPSLATALLHLVNSAFYNFPSRIDTIDRAVAIVGTTQIHALAMGRMVLNMVDSLTPPHFNMDAFWEHSIACGILAKGLAGLRGIKDTERIFLSGMVHDIGKLGMATAMPQHSKTVSSMEHIRVSFEVEREVAGFGHGRFGAMVLRKLDIPYPIVEAVAFHHNPTAAQHKEGASILHVADFLTRAIVVHSALPSPIPPLSNEAWASLEIDPEDVKPLIDGLMDQLEEMVSILTG